jgi:Protein of unknown function (DUF3667)
MAWTCPTCNAPVATRFCPTCGEAPVSPREQTLSGLAKRLLQAFTSIDTKTARSVWTLLRAPGSLTVSWMKGVRKVYVAPITLFLFVNVLFFAVQSLTGETVFSSPLESHLHHQDWSEFAYSLVTPRLEASGTPLDTYARIFDSAVVIHAKSLIILMTVPFALLLPLVFLRARRPFVTHVVFSLHLYAFLLLLFCLALLAAKVSAWLGFGGLQDAAVDNVLSVFNLVACGLYIYMAIRPVYDTAGVRRVLQALALAIAVAAIVIGYRFALFLITLYTT